MKVFLYTQKYKQKLWDYLKGLEDNKYLIKIVKKDGLRSLAQNALFHKWLSEISQQVYLSGMGKRSPKWWKVLLKDHFLGYEVFETAPGKQITELIHTSDLGVKDMRQFMDDVKHYVGAEYNCTLTEPNDLIDWYLEQ